MERIKKIANIVILIILLPILFVSAVILINSYIYPDKIPSFFGWKPFIVLSGSMANEISVGDLVIVKETNHMGKGDIIAFREEDMVITHRIVDIIEKDNTKKYITKGDNNSAQDGNYVLPEQVEGVYQFKVNGLGNLALFIQTPTGMVVCLSLPILLLIVMQLVDSVRNKKNMREDYKKEKELEEEIRRLKEQNEKLSKENKDNVGN